MQVQGINRPGPAIVWSKEGFCLASKTRRDSCDVPSTDNLTGAYAKHQKPGSRARQALRDCEGQGRINPGFSLSSKDSGPGGFLLSLATWAAMLISQHTQLEMPGFRAWAAIFVIGMEAGSTVRHTLLLSLEPIAHPCRG